MKELILLRHAKSSWDYSVEDRNRPLAQKGIARIIKMSRVSKSIFENCDVVFSSPANRALHTAVLMMHTIGISLEKLEVTESLYTFDSERVIRFVRSIDDRLDKSVCVGHNPAFTIAANRLGSKSCDNLTTAAWARISFEQTRWEKVKNGRSELGLPRNLLVHEN